MTPSFIILTIAFVGMLILYIFQCIENKRLKNNYLNLLKRPQAQKGLDIYGIMGTGCGTSTKQHKRIVKFINIGMAGRNDTLNKMVEQYQNEGYILDREKSTDRLLVFAKWEEVKPKTSEAQ